MQLEKEDNFQSFHLFWVDEIDSTNTYLKNHYQNNEDFSVLIARIQTQGRGRYDRVWESDEDLCFSILFKKSAPHFMLAPLAVVLALQSFHIEAFIKWPNDIYLSGKKLAGILIESLYEPQLIASIVGIGINLKDKPTVGGIGVSLDKELLLKAILKQYETLLGYDKKDCLSLYRKYSFVIGKYINYEGTTYFVENINEDGSLRLSSPQEIRNVYSNEIDIKSALL